jgi:membrane protease YdiL (CAAX protease family)
MYIEQGFKGSHEAWRYLVGLLIILAGWQLIGSLPLVAALIISSLQTGTMPTDIPGMTTLLGSNTFLFLMLLTFAIGLVTVFLTVRYLHRQSLTSLTTSRNRIDWNRIAFAFLLWSVISVVFIALDIYFSPEDYVYNFQWAPFLILLLIGSLLIPLQTSFEEYFIRGYLMQGTGILTGNRWWPLLLTSLIFGLLHMFNPEVEKMGYGIMVFYMGTGLFLGILTLMDEGLELALGFHAANNLTAALLVTADWTAFQTHSVYRDIAEPELGWDVFLPVLVIYPIMLIIFSRKYGWSNWKERLTGKVRPTEIPLDRSDK